jgi:hypothetical protein
LAKTANIPDPYEPIFLRRSRLKGYAGLKSIPWTAMKRERPETSLFEDFVYVREQLLKLIELYEHAASEGISLSRAIYAVHPVASPDEVEMILDQLRDEARNIPAIYRMYIAGEYGLTPAIEGLYEKEQLRSPKLDVMSPKAYVPFMTKQQSQKWHEEDFMREIREKRRMAEEDGVAPDGEYVPIVVDDDDE